MKSIPFLLIYSRIVIAIIIGAIAFLKIENYSTWIVVLLIVGLLTDVFDGIIARKLNVATEKLRVWDSNVDQFFWLISIGSIFALNMGFLKDNLILIITVVILEIICYLLSYLKFSKPIATHSLLAKVWTISILVFMIDLCLHSTSTLPFYICIILGIISRIEISLIILKLKKWTTDVPSIWVVNKLNRGIKINKNKLFN